MKLVQKPIGLLVFGDSHIYGVDPWDIPWTLRGLEELVYRAQYAVAPLVLLGSQKGDAATNLNFHRFLASNTNTVGGASIAEYLAGTGGCHTVETIWASIYAANKVRPTHALIESMSTDLWTDDRTWTAVKADIQTLISQIAAKDPAIKVVLATPHLLASGAELASRSAVRSAILAGEVAGVWKYWDRGGYTESMSVAGAADDHPTIPADPTTLAAWSGVWSPQTIGVQWLAGGLFEALYQRGLPTKAGENWSGLS